MKFPQAKNLILSISASLLLSALSLSASAAFQGPPAGANPPTGGGLMGVDPNRNIQLFDIQAGSANATPAGTLDGAAFGRVFMITADNNPGIGVKDIGAGRGYVLTARNDGTLALWDDVARAVRFYVDQEGNIAVGSTDPALAKLHVFGNTRTEGSFIGGRMQASYLASDVFGGFTGGGNYAFPAALGIGTNSIGGLPANGLYVAGSVGIGTTDVQIWEKLAVSGAISLQGSDPDGLSSLTSERSGKALRLKARGGNYPDLVIATNGNVGIGTANPSQKLEVAGQVLLNAAAPWIYFNDTDGTQGYITTYDNRLYVGKTNSPSTANDILVIGTGGSYAGNVGIGTTSPGDKLTVANGAISVIGDSCDDEANFKIKNGELILQWSGGGNCGYPPNRMGLLLHNAELTNAVGLPSGALDTANTTYAFQSAFAGYPANRIKIKNGDFSFGYKAASTIASFTEGDWQDRLFIEGATGEVGIGTTNPTTKLHVAGDVKVEGDVIANNTGAATEISAANVSQGTFGSLSTKGNYKFEGALNTNPVLFIDATNEKIGIGTAGPAEKLEVAGNVTITNGKFTISHNSDAIEQYFQDSADSDYFKWRFQRNADVLGLHSSGVPYPSYIMAITKTGNVGIGTTNPPPWSKLAVNGDIVFTSEGSWTGYSVLTSEAAGKPLVLKARGGANPDLVVHTSGNIGIGTASPGDKLTVVDGAIGMDGNCDDETNFKIKNGQLILQWSGGGGCGHPPNRMGLLLHNAELTNAVGLPSGALDTANTTYAFQTAFAGYPANRIKIKNGDFSFGYKAASTITSFTEADWQDRLFIEGGTGEVGIGTTNPTTKLHVAGDVKVEGDVIANNTGAATEISAANVSQGTFGSLSTKGNYKFEGALNTNPVLFVDATNERVGIGTTSPGAKLGVSGNLQVEGSGTSYLRALSGTDMITMDLSTNNKFRVTGGDLATERFWVDTSGKAYIAGNVGIGTTGPSAKLQVEAPSTAEAHIYTFGTGAQGVDKGSLIALGGAFTDAGAVVPFGFIWGKKENAVNTNQAGYLAFGTRRGAGGAPEYMRITSAGYVGIGNTNPQHALDIQGAYYSRMVVKGNVSGAVPINWNEGNVQHITLAGNVTLTFTGGQSGGRYVLVVKQDATVSRTVTWPTNTRFPGGATFNVTATAGRSDYLGFLYNGVDAKYDNVAFSAAFF